MFFIIPITPANNAIEFRIIVVITDAYAFVSFFRISRMFLRIINAMKTIEWRVLEMVAVVYECADTKRL